MTHGATWPVHPKPLPDELLSSWIVRLAQANCIKLQTMTRILFGTSLSPWNRDSDRSAPSWLIKAISRHTGANQWEVLHTTLVTYRARLYRKRRAFGQLKWILPVGNNGTKHQAFGQQFCPECLSSDTIPYFRKQWRLALFTYCPEHQIKLHDSCPGCGRPVVHYRGDFGREWSEALPMYVCSYCGMDFREAPRNPPPFPNEELHRLFDDMLLSLGRPADEAKRFDLGFFVVLHQLCRVIDSKPNKGKLQRYLAQQIGITHPTPVKTHPFEWHRRQERHLQLLSALWLLADLEPRLRSAWLAKAVRYNHLIKDFERMPKWYGALVKEFSNWRRATPV